MAHFLNYFYLGEFTGTEIFETDVPIVPHSWYHVCLGLDTRSGLLRITVNGHVVQNEVKEFLKNTSLIKPKSVSGKLQGK